MQLPFEVKSKTGLSAEVFALCLLLASALQIAEVLVPRIPIFPWLRLGLAYLVILPFLIRFGAFNATILFLCRNVLALLYGGQMFSSFIISSIAGCFTLLLAGNLLVWLFNRDIIGLLGLSTLLAVCFNLVQLYTVELIFIRHSGFYFQLGPVLIWSILSGSLIAFLVYKSRGTLERMFSGDTENLNDGVEKSEQKKNKVTLPTPNPFRSLLPGNLPVFLQFAVPMLLFITVFLIQQIWFQAIVFVLILILSRFGKIKILIYAWPFYFYLAWLHLFQTEGFFIYRDWITKEGFEGFILHSLRISSIILCGQWIGACFRLLNMKRFGQNLYVRGFILAMPLLPSIFGVAISLGKDFFRRLLKKEFSGLLEPFINRFKKELLS
ncbi:MAG: Gx transporter family protein [Fibrobacteria bacterium]|nr:Gx transporter family protein [Fibrobacteria bacterium]